MTSYSNGDLVIADGRRIRFVDDKGIIFTLSGLAKDMWKPQVHCKWQVTLAEMNFEWPTEVKVNPIDESLLVLDSGNIYQMMRRENVIIPYLDMCQSIEK